MKRVCPHCGRARRKVAPSRLAFLSGKYPSCNATNDEKEKNSKRIAYFVHGENKKGGEYRRIIVIFCEKSKGSCVFVKCGVPQNAEYHIEQIAATAKVAHLSSAESAYLPAIEKSKDRRKSATKKETIVAITAEISPAADIITLATSTKGDNNMPFIRHFSGSASSSKYSSYSSLIMFSASDRDALYRNNMFINCYFFITSLPPI